MEDTGFLRVAALAPALRVGDIQFNLDQLRQETVAAARASAGLVLLPELCLTGATAGDLFFQEYFYQTQMEAVAELIDLTASLPTALVFGFYLRAGGRLYNCAGLAKGGHLLGLAAQETPAADGLARWFSQAVPATLPKTVSVAGRAVPFGRLLFNDAENHISLTLSVGSDLLSPSAALHAGLITLCPAAWPELIGSAAVRRQACLAASRIPPAAYCFASAGSGESTGDAVYSGHCLIAEAGRLLSETSDPAAEAAAAWADIDCTALLHRRAVSTHPVPAEPAADRAVVDLSPLYLLSDSTPLNRRYSPLPFVPTDPTELAARCREAFHVQTIGLRRRLVRSRSRRLILGVSGGLDSTLALLVAANALRQADRPTNDLIAVTLPGFGTTDQTYQNALTLMRLLGTDAREINICDAVSLHFRDIGHDPTDYSAVYENVQARERTQILMDIANRENGIQIGTGDLSEAALGWSTYNGDHMAMYNVNAGNPKTFIRAQINWFCHEFLDSTTARPFSQDDAELAQALTRILATPISPELLPPDATGNIAQKTEDQVGPYILHDFFLYHIVRDGWPPQRILRVARQTFADQFSQKELLAWLTVFYRRFITHQFKRNCSPDGVRVGSISLTPRAGYVMPSDLDPALWLAELDSLA